MTDKTPVPPSPSRWTPEVVIGLLSLLAAVVLPHLDLDGIASALGLFAAWLLGPVPSFLTPRQGPPRGYARADVLVTALALGLALFGVVLLAASAGGCAALERREVPCMTAPESLLEDLPDGRCALRGYCDGHELWTAIGPGPCGEVEDNETQHMLADDWLVVTS